ncbi:hypothetical protein [Moorena sp. SIO4G3]|uniref:hypothetical protein n=1 Tax=Moorena sp. SIO4G3 TaxID=2607821 RepID=UPI00142A6F28|nr:hypothetical protein [Moorena sp. SIO4G3]NEO82045.1 hypothetical protein [Moorena sp. SIO4G3]
MHDTAANGKVTWVTVVKVLKKCLIRKPQSDQYMRDLIPDYPHNVFARTVVISEEGIGKLGTKLPQE